MWTFVARCPATRDSLGEDCQQGRESQDRAGGGGWDNGVLGERAEQAYQAKVRKLPVPTLASDSVNL